MDTYVEMIERLVKYIAANLSEKMHCFAKVVTV